MKFKNNLNHGSVRYIIFKEDNVWYGVGLEFNIVVEGDNPTEAMASLFSAINGYAETARKLKMRPLPLNQKPDKEYQDLWTRLEKDKTEKTSATTSPKEIFTFGYSPFRNLALAS